MIKLIVNPEKEAKVESFDKETIIIGSGKIPECDLFLDDELIKEKHLQICREKENFYLINLSHDPFATLNDLPFGKKRLKNNDRVVIGDEIIQIAGLEEKERKPAVKKPKTAAADEMDDLEFDQILKEIEEAEEAVPPKEAKQEKPPIPFPQPKKTQVEKKASDWKPVFLLIFAILILSGSLLGFTYYWQATQKSGEFEKRVAGTVSDTAMSILYAKLNHITPPNQQWSNPDFINEQLTKILSPKVHSLATFDHKGSFQKLPYLLRIYTSPELSRFLIIAQPTPGFLPLWTPSNAIILDSRDMEIRKVSNIRDLNRLLIQTNPLDENKGNEISQMIANQPNLPLEEIGADKASWGFQTPPALSLLRPGAENKIYNAMRYYPLGEEMLEQTLAIFSHFHEAENISKVQEKIDDLTDLPQLIFYSSKGIEGAKEAQKAIDAFVPEKQVLIGYLKTDPKGMIVGAHLLVDTNTNNLQYDSQQISSTRLSHISRLEKTNHVDQSHPLYHHLKTMMATRHKLLLPFREEIFQIISNQTQQIRPDFDHQLKETLNSFFTKDEELRETMTEQLKDLLLEYPHVPLEELATFADSTGLTPLLLPAIAGISQGNQGIEERELQERFNEISVINDLETLHEKVIALSEHLTLSEIPNFEVLKERQGQFQSVVLHQLKNLLLTNTGYLPHTLTLDHSRSLLVEILISSWVRDPLEFDYFLKEHDRLYEETLGVPFHEG